MAHADLISSLRQLFQEADDPVPKAQKGEGAAAADALTAAKDWSSEAQKAALDLAGQLVDQGAAMDDRGSRVVRKLSDRLGETAKSLGQLSQEIADAIASVQQPTR
jgi:hypothetical protein